MAWAGTVQLDPGRMVYFGTTGDVPLHSSIAIGLILVVSGHLELRDARGGSVTLRAGGGPAAAVLPSGHEHAVPILPSAGSPPTEPPLTPPSQTEPSPTDSARAGAPQDELRHTVPLQTEPPRAGQPPAAPGATAPTEAVLAIVDPEGPAGRTLVGRLGATGYDLDSVECWVAAARPCWSAVARPAPDDPAGTRLVDAAIRTLTAAAAPAPAVHPALRRAVALIPARLAGGVTLRDLSVDVGLSTSRLGHLFTTELGLPFRAYVRWARLRTCVDVLRAGGTLTDAAHAAGFTDSAHMNRVCRQVFGINPSVLIQHLTWT